MTNKKLIITVLVLLCMAAVCLYAITEDGSTKTMTLTKPDGTTILLTHVSDHP